MRVQRITIRKWRHFDNISLTIPGDAGLVCLVGGNGTGKSQILELISAAANQIGLSQGFESNRGYPFGENADFEIEFFISSSSVPAVEVDAVISTFSAKTKDIWDRTLTVISSNNITAISAGGLSVPFSYDFAKGITNVIRASSFVHYLVLDADRAYPRVQIQPHEYHTIFQTDWEGSKKERSFVSTKNLYEEWFKYLIGTENQENGNYIASVRLAREHNEPDPTFVDGLKSYGDALRSVLPHLIFTGINSQAGRILFDSTGTPLHFDQLSGGEREIAFQIGQIERFKLRKGLLLIDEPELHLNYDLLRQWISFLKSTVEEGQIWLASHSLEVVEVAGQDNTFILERDAKSRRVNSCSPLANRPAVATLSRAVGSPAFSLANLTFIFIEGEESVGERERFRLICDALPEIRFMEGGSCREVQRRLRDLNMIAASSGENLRIGGVVDRDWRAQIERDNLCKQGLFVLDVHEIENLFLHPATAQRLMKNISVDPTTYDSALIASADARAGMWIFDHARTQKVFEDFPPPHPIVRSLIQKLKWADISPSDESCSEIAAADPILNKDQIELLTRYLKTSRKVYARLREGEDLWRRCEGKEVFRSLVETLGLSNAETAERAIIGIWQSNPQLVPKELAALREYVGRLSEK